MNKHNVASQIQGVLLAIALIACMAVLLQGGQHPAMKPARAAVPTSR